MGFTLANWCHLCHENKETLDHLLHCVKVRLLWELFLSLFGVMWVNRKSTWNTLWSWNGCGRKKTKKGVVSGSFMHILDDLEGKE